MASATKQPVVKDPSNSSVRVEIFDQAYHLRGSDPDYIIKLADYVDTKMRAVAEQTSTVDSVRLAVLAALNIADEYHMMKRKTGRQRARLQATSIAAIKRARRRYSSERSTRLRQAKCQLFAPRLLRICRAFPSIQPESRPAKFVMVVTDF